MKKRFIAITMVLVMCILATACAKKTETEDVTKEATPAVTDETEETKDTTADAPKDGEYKVLIGASNMSGSFYSWLANSTKKAVEAKGMKADIVDLNSDAAAVITLIEQAVAGGYNGIILDKPDHEQDTTELLAQAKEKGVFNVHVNDAGDNPDGVSSYVGLDNYTLGRNIGDAAAKMLPQGASGLILKATAGNQGSEDRYNGFIDALKDAGRADVKVLAATNSKDWSKEGAMAVMEDWTQVYSDFDFLYSMCDDMTIGAIEVCEAAGYDTQKIMFFGIDGLANGCNAVKAGTMKATILQNATDEAEYAANAIYDMMSGKDTTGKIYALDGTVITKDNVDEILAMHEANGMLK